MPDPRVYVLLWADPHYPDRPYVYADREDALADPRNQITAWMTDYARTSGVWMHVRPDPAGYESRDVAPSPASGARWSARAMEVAKP